MPVTSRQYGGINKTNTVLAERAARNGGLVSGDEKVCVCVCDLWNSDPMLVDSAQSWSYRDSLLQTGVPHKVTWVMGMYGTQCTAVDPSPSNLCCFDIRVHATIR